ncbi:MAG: hypothetical protein KJ069_14455 [Anaerolineae bacterium]|nr:hypothetical protein [Anaerolineae bacterium]
MMSVRDNTAVTTHFLTFSAPPKRVQFSERNKSGRTAVSPLRPFFFVAWWVGARPCHMCVFAHRQPIFHRLLYNYPDRDDREQ